MVSVTIERSSLRPTRNARQKISSLIGIDENTPPVKPDVEKRSGRMRKATNQTSWIEGRNKSVVTPPAKSISSKLPPSSKPTSATSTIPETRRRRTTKQSAAAAVLKDISDEMYQTPSGRVLDALYQTPRKKGFFSSVTDEQFVTPSVSSMKRSKTSSMESSASSMMAPPQGSPPKRRTRKRN